jgi:hypothetical protein
MGQYATLKKSMMEMAVTKPDHIRKSGLYIGKYDLAEKRANRSKKLGGNVKLRGETRQATNEDQIQPKTKIKIKQESKTESFLEDYDKFVSHYNQKK